MSEAQEQKVASPKGKRKRERVEIKGNPFHFIAKYDMSFFKDEIIKFIYDMRVVKTNQLYKIYGSRFTTRWIRSTLQNLYENQFLYRKFALSNEKGSTDAMYFLDRIGAMYLANELKVQMQELKWSIEDNAIGPDALRHTIDITEIRTAMHEFGKNNGVEVRKFIGERRLGRIKFKKGEDEMEFNPDGEIVLSHDGRLYLFLLEYDTGTENKSVIEDKVEKYEAFYKSKDFNDYYPTHPTILIIGNDILRTHRLKMWIEKKRTILEINYCFTSLEEFAKNPFGNIFDNFKYTDKVDLFK